MLISILATLALSHAAAPTPTTEKVPVKPGFQAMDMNQFRDVAPQKSSALVQVSMGCTTATGTEYKANDTGFNSCMTDAVKPGAPRPAGSTQNVNFNLGK